MTKKKETETKSTNPVYAVPERPQDNIPAEAPVEKPKKKAPAKKAKK